MLLSDQVHIQLRSSSNKYWPGVILEQVQTEAMSLCGTYSEGNKLREQNTMIVSIY